MDDLYEMSIGQKTLLPNVHTREIIITQIWHIDSLLEAFLLSRRHSFRKALIL